MESELDDVVDGGHPKVAFEFKTEMGNRQSDTGGELLQSNRLGKLRFQFVFEFEEFFRNRG